MRSFQLHRVSKTWVRSALFTPIFALIFCFQVFAFPVQLANSPKNNLALTLSAIRSAKKSLLINIYEFTEPAIADAIIERIQAGIHVEILQEGQPVGGIQASAREIERRLLEAMSGSHSGDRYLMMKAASREVQRRFRFDHAKYVVVDGEALLVSSENYSPSGHPVPGTKGNRGWEVFIQESEISRDFAKLFQDDSNPAFGDITDLTRSAASERSRGGICFFCPSQIVMTFFEIWNSNSPHLPSLEGSGFLTADATDVEKIISPDNSLSGLLQLIQNANSTLDLEQMTFSMDWKEAGTRSPLFNAVVSAAERGVKVRILLNDESVFYRQPTPRGSQDQMAQLPPELSRVNKNKQTVDSLNQIAQNRGLSLEARIANLDAMGVSIIHNKGALIDGTQTLISSINWNENSVTHNRETAVKLTSSEVYRYFKALFEQDWSAR